VNWRNGSEPTVGRTCRRAGVCHHQRVSSTDPTRGQSEVEPVDGGAPVEPERHISWSTRLIIGFVVLVALVVGYFIATSLLPRWWAHRVGAVADGSLTAGIFAGLTCGVVFTVLPLLLLRLMLGRRARWGLRLTYLVLAAVAAAPNLITLGIVLGTNNAAHAGERIMDVEASGFRGATLVGAVAGAVLMVAAWSLLFSRRRRKHEVERLRSELKRREAEAAETSTQD